MVRERQEDVDEVLRNLEIIGEAARNVPDEVENRHPSVPYRRIVCLRNFVIHHYFGVDLSVVWVIVSPQLDELEEEIKKIIEREC
ncbi:HepT-like ribonuclease domain-containing protein [Thermococcus sp.]|uniref:HepT-like ribonuclease domain-containing protein n=1 Tax=Thermococcus sp. TaxID=35749 RepID=UPI0025DBCA92|nr:HepT-like ribonuclease domain-containing protein [Thermococcus sp.]